MLALSVGTMPKTKKSKTGTTLLRNFVFTINNYTDDDIEKVRALPAKYLVFGKEVGEEKTPHLQGYCELEKRMRFGGVSKLIPRAYLAKRKGNAKQAADYCKKEGDFEEQGTISEPGKRSDITDYIKDIKAGKTEDEISDLHGACYCKYPRAYSRLSLLSLRKNNKHWKQLKVYIIWGTAGAGKSKSVYAADPDVYACTKNCKWFDLYDGQKTILLEEFRGQVDYEYLLRLLDGYPFALPIKGGFTWKCWDTVYLTSNTDPADWYPMGMTPALARRITKITKMEDPVADCEILVE